MQMELKSPAEEEEEALELTDEEVDEEDLPVEETTWWRLTHALSFLGGGLTFLVGTFLYYWPTETTFAWISGWLYVVGSCGFLYVDVQEFFTFTEPLPLRVNISISAIGSTLYIIGSAGYLPTVAAWHPEIGEWGFILGSFFIGSSEIWKLVRINREEGICKTKEGFTSACVEAGACLGAWSFFVGTIWYLHGPLDNTTVYNSIITIWMFGSLFFSLGGASLAYRHFVMEVS